MCWPSLTHLIKGTNGVQGLGEFVIDETEAEDEDVGSTVMLGEDRTFTSSTWELTQAPTCWRTHV
jgi:hypothetical protein